MSLVTSISQADEKPFFFNIDTFSVFFLVSILFVVRFLFVTKNDNCSHPFLKGSNTFDVSC